LSFRSMELQELIQFMKRKWQTVVLFMLSFAVLAFAFSIVQPQKYKSEQRFLVVASYAEDVDPYAATRSTEYIANLLSEVMYSQDFLDQVLHSGYAVDASLFPELPKKRQKAWKKTISTRVLGDTGILDVSVYHTNRATTEQLALAVGQVLRTQHSKYHSRGGSLTIQTIDAPITSLHPVEPNLLLNTGIGLALGLIAGLAFIYLFPKKELVLYTKEQYRLVVPQEPVWTEPIAKPKPQVAFQPAPMPIMAQMYESAEFKYPAGSAEEQSTEIGYSTPNPEPPLNLPIG